MELDQLPDRKPYQGSPPTSVLRAALSFIMRPPSVRLAALRAVDPQPLRLV
jgi:hypothetical protein